MAGGSASPRGGAQERGLGLAVVGAVIDGKYKVDRVLGAGGMGVVVAATHVQLGSAVAIKLVRPEVAKHSEVVARFQREARIAAQLKSDHVARVTDIGTLPGEPAGVPYMVLELLDGTDLAMVLQQRGPLPCEEAVSLVLQACEAVDEAHELGIIHRDLKPANLFLVRRPKGRPIVKVLDFGISSMAAGVEDARLTATGAVMGTPLYMAPEQMLDARKADRRSDIWALGAILYELLSGVPPFPGNTFGQVHAKVITTEAGSIRATRPDVPAELEGIVLRCLRKPPEQRFQTIAELEDALRPFSGPQLSQPSLPNIEAPSSSPRHTTNLLSAGTAVRDHSTLLLGQPPPVVQPAPVFGPPPGPVSAMTNAEASSSGGTSISWDAKTTLVMPENRRRRTTIGIAAAVVVLGGAAVILGMAFLRGGAQSSPVAAATATPTLATSAGSEAPATAIQASPPEVTPSAAITAAAASPPLTPPRSSAVRSPPAAVPKPSSSARVPAPTAKPPPTKRSAPSMANER